MDATTGASGQIDAKLLGVAVLAILNAMRMLAPGRDAARSTK